MENIVRPSSYYRLFPAAAAAAALVLAVVVSCLCFSSSLPGLLCLDVILVSFHHTLNISLFYDEAFINDTPPALSAY